MEEHKGAKHFHSERSSVVTIGTFDGVHMGHQKIIERLVKSAKENKLDSVILTFFPHPRMVLQKESGIKLINTIEERKEILEKMGIDHLVVHPFTIEFSHLEAEAYVRDVLVKQLKAQRIIIGYDHRFGRNRTADINDLREIGKIYGIEVEEISRQEIEEVAVSSTKIRKALQRGKVEKANRYLRYPFAIKGEVVKGKGLGKQFQYPTANIAIAEDYKLIPQNGVYVVRSEIDNRSCFGLMSIGTNPTVGGTQRTIETHFLDFDADLYGRVLSIEMLCRIRDEEHFASIEALKAAMKHDEEYARKYIQKNHAQ